jgi:cellulose synthase operon protein C
MPGAGGRRLWWCIALGAVMLVTGDAAAIAKDAAEFVKNAEGYLAKGNLKAAEIELRNAARDAPDDPVVRGRLAEIYLQLGDLASAEREARAAAERAGDEADYLPLLTDTLLRRYKYGEVLSLIQPGERHPALESKLRAAVGVAAAALHDWDRAEAMLRDAVRLDPSAMRPKLLLARFLNGRSHPEEADRLIDEAIAANPRTPEALQAKGEMLWARGAPDPAKGQFDAVLELDPSNLRARLSRAEINIAQNNFAAADEDLDPILKTNPNDFLATYLRALELFKKHDYTAADRLCDRISSGFATFPAGYYLQGAIKVALKQFSKAEIILARYLERLPGDARAVRLIAHAAVQQHGAPRAIDYLKPLAEKSPADAATLAALGDAYMADGKPERALQYFEKAAVIDPENPTIKTAFAVSAIDAGESQRGLSQLEQVFAGSEAGAIVAGPTLVLSELRAGHVGKAAEIASSLIKRDPGNPVYQRLIGAARVAQHDSAGAEAAFRAALARDPEFGAAAHDLAQLYLLNGRIDDARKVYSDFAARNAENVTGLLGLADIAMSEGKWSDATDLINRARTIARNDPAPGLKLITLYEMRRDWNSAKAVAGELSTRFPRNANVVAAQARTQMEAGDTGAAISSYKLAHQLSPNSAPILSRYIALLNQTKYYREARDVLREAIARDPRNASFKADLIRAEAEVGGLDAALSEARRFAKDEPDNTQYDLISAELYEKAGRLAEAADLLKKAVAARPSDDKLTIALSRLHGHLGEFAAAEAALTRRLQADPKTVVIAPALASLYQTTGRPDDAKKVYRDLLSQKPDDIAALIALADLLTAERKWSEAAGYLGRARAAAPNDPEPGLKLVTLYALRQDWKSAAAIIAELATKFPTNLDVLDTQARVQLASGDSDGAIITYKRAHELAPNSQMVLSRYLAVLRAAKNFREARRLLQAALDRDPKNTSLKAEIVRIEFEISGLDGALLQVRNFALYDQENSLYDVLSAELYERAGRVAEATALLEKTVAARPSDGDLTIALSGVYRRMGNLIKAEEILNDRLKIDPTDYDVRSALTAFYLHQQRYDDAIPHLARLVAERPTDPTPLNNLAWLYQQQGDLAKARKLAERAFMIAPRTASIDDTLGWILLAQGSADQAISYLGAANLSAPQNPAIRYHLAVALHRAGRSTEAQAMLESLLGSGLFFADKAAAERLLQQLKRG